MLYVSAVKFQHFLARIRSQRAHTRHMQPRRVQARMRAACVPVLPVFRVAPAATFVLQGRPMYRHLTGLLSWHQQVRATCMYMYMYMYMYMCTCTLRAVCLKNVNVLNPFIVGKPVHRYTHTHTHTHTHTYIYMYTHTHILMSTGAQRTTHAHKHLQHVTQQIRKTEKTSAKPCSNERTCNIRYTSTSATST